MYTYLNICNNHFFLKKPRPPSSTLFPYTTLFRSRQARHLVRLMTQNSESCAKVIHHMTHECESWKHHKSHTYEIQTPMTHNCESYETISSLSQIRDRVIGFGFHMYEICGVSMTHT